MLLQRFAQFVKQPRVLDGDDGLSGKVSHKLYLFLSEWPHLLSEDGNCAKQLVVLEHWHNEQRSSAGHVDHGNKRRVLFEVERLRFHVGDLQHLLRGGNACKWVVWASFYYRMTAAVFDE
ncbi:MAG: hypothetical protein WA728_30920 [Xanthobacteraceae bacterium]